MKYETFLKKVRDMRCYQKAFAATRTAVALRESRRLEREVDAEINLHLPPSEVAIAPPVPLPTLFDKV